MRWKTAHLHHFVLRKRLAVLAVCQAEDLIDITAASNGRHGSERSHAVFQPLFHLSPIALGQQVLQQTVSLILIKFPSSTPSPIVRLF
jgi:hypothetical protein